jgi:hypothetical protein
MYSKMLIPFLITLFHFIFDFIFQDEQWVTNKSKNFLSLLSHTSTYSFLWVFGIMIPLVIQNPNCSNNWLITHCVLFGILTFIFHTITDFFTSKVVKRLFENKKYGSSIPNLGAFSMIGFDQVLHYAQLFFTFQFVLSV